MLKIIICDDDHFTIQFLSRLLERSIQISRTKARIVCQASSGTELLNFIQKSPGPYVYFLDFDFGKKELNGIDLVRKIYQQDPGGKVIFVTSHADKGMEILRSGIQASGFIEKDADQQNMTAEFIKYLKMLETDTAAASDAAFIELPIGIDETIRLCVPEIAYVDSVKTISHSICYHTLDGSEITVRDTMEHALELLGEGFIRCHRSVIVNKTHVISLDKGLLKLSNGRLVSCALGKRKELLELCFSREDL